MTANDRGDLDFMLRIGVDWIALSFVQRAADMADLRQMVDGRASILAKIEKPAALTDLEAILDVSDGLMVARGDLGVELAPEDVPVAQKTIVRAARRRGDRGRRQRRNRKRPGDAAQPHPRQSQAHLRHPRGDRRAVR